MMRRRRSSGPCSSWTSRSAQAVGPGELDIPAVRGLGGSLIYFVDHKSGLDRLWDADFEPVADGAGDFTGAGLTSVDHLSQSMHYEEMLTWLLFYISLLDVRKTPVQNVIDPGRRGAKPGRGDRRRRSSASFSTPLRAGRPSRRAF